MQQPFCVYEDVYQVGGAGISHPADCAVYMIDCGAELVLIDCGAGAEGSLEAITGNIEALGFDLEKLSTVIATHRHIDHIGSLWRLKRDYGAKVVAHELDTEGIERGTGTVARMYGIDYQPCPVDIKVGGESGSLSRGRYEMNIIHIPGHTPGGIAVYVDMGSRVLFGQDIHGPYSLPGADREQARQSLSMLMQLEADILCEGHFGIYKPEEKVRSYIDSYLVRL